MPFLKHGMCNGQQMITGGDPGHDADLGIFNEFLSLRDSAIVTKINNFAVSAALVEVSGLQLLLLVTQRASRAAQCIVIGPVCLFVGVGVCYHDNSKLRTCIDLHQTGSVGKGGDISS